MRAKYRQVRPLLAIVYRYVSSADTIDVTVYPKQSVAVGSTIRVISIDNEIERFESSLEAAHRDGTVSGYEVPIKDSVSFLPTGKLQRSLPGRRVVAVMRSAGGNTSVLYVYYYQVGESIIEVRTSTPSAEFYNTDIVDFVDAVMKDATDGVGSPHRR